jgi:hypothetical protein
MIAIYKIKHSERLVISVRKRIYKNQLSNSSAQINVIKKWKQ